MFVRYTGYHLRNCCSGIHHMMWPSVQAAFALLSYLGTNPFKPWSPAVPYAETLDYTWKDHQGHGGAAWAKAYHQAALAVKDMTLDEKVSPCAAIGVVAQYEAGADDQINMTSAWNPGPCPSQIGGVPRLNISGMCFDDGRESGFPQRGIVLDHL